MCKQLISITSGKILFTMVSIVMGLVSPVMGQTDSRPTVDRFQTVSIEAQRLIIQSSSIEGERAKGIALKRPIRKMVGRYGSNLGFKSPMKRPSSARRIIIRQPRTYMSGIP
jgi:hypothetical protein